MTFSFPVANKWVHEYGQEFRRRCSLNPEEWKEQEPQWLTSFNDQHLQVRGRKAENERHQQQPHVFKRTATAALWREDDSHGCLMGAVCVKRVGWNAALRSDWPLVPAYEDEHQIVWWKPNIQMFTQVNLWSCSVLTANNVFICFITTQLGKK